jgi:tetratricopeptide (TPR) repeat protein
MTAAFHAHGAEIPLQGAEALIGKIRTELTASTPAAQPAEDTAIAAYRTDRDTFLKTAPTLPAAEAAAAWLALADRFWKLPAPPSKSNPFGSSFSYYSSSSDSINPLSFPGLIAALPPPESWPLIQEKLDQAGSDPLPEAQARIAVLRAAFAFLNRDPARLKAALDFLGKQSASLERYERDQFRDKIRESEEWIARLKGGSEDAAVRFEKKLKKAGSDSGSDISVDMPDLVTLAGPEKADSLIHKALAMAGLRLEVTGKATFLLAQKTALAELKKLPSPQWTLVDPSPQGLALFEGLSRKFGQPKSQEESADTDKEPGPETPAPDQEGRGWNGYGFRNDFEHARTAYLFGLLLHNRSEDALKQALSLKEEDISEYAFESAWKQHEAAPPAAVLAVFLGKWLEVKPDLPLWDAYVQLAAVAGHTNEAIQLLDKTAARRDLSVPQQFEVAFGKSSMFLALDRTEEAVVLWRALSAVTATNEMPPVQIRLETRKLELGQTWAKAGLALKRTDWFDEGAALAERARKRLAELKPDEGYSRYSRCSDTVMEGLLELKRFGEAEQRAWTDLTDALETAKKRTNPMGDSQPVDLSSAMGQLMTVYSKAGRHADVLALFEKAPWWGGATNLAGLESDTFFVPAAEALQAAGRNDEARALLIRHLATKPGDDKAYRVLIQIPSPDLIPTLDRLYARDRFEERPLIWKAAVLLKAGKLDEAEALARQALKVDPTDGEEPPGDRVLGYAVLADILAAKGKADDAVFFRKVVKSVRIAEEGDAMNDAGLTTRSLKLYGEAETFFADAYCIQWRLAERLQALGQTEEAQKHYQIAFERMPEQFGQVATLCFGCMGVFNNPESRSAAEVVLTRLATNTPARPAVFFLLGQLREEQERYKDAYAEYRKAVALDPDYLDVWEKINSLRDKLDLPATEWDAIQLRMMRMDPLGRHIYIRPEELTDLKGFWTAQQEAMKLGMPGTGGLLPLAASLEAEAKRPASPMGSYPHRGNYRYYTERSRLLPPGDTIAKFPFLAGLDAIQSALGLCKYNSKSDGYRGRGFDMVF